MNHTHFYSDGQILGVSAHPKGVRSELRNLPRTGTAAFRLAAKRKHIFFLSFVLCNLGSPLLTGSNIIPQLAFRILHPWPARDLPCSRMFWRHSQASLKGPNERLTTGRRLRNVWEERLPGFYSEWTSRSRSDPSFIPLSLSTMRSQVSANDAYHP